MKSGTKKIDIKDEATCPYPKLTTDGSTIKY
jgi:hypothetical protein